MRLTKDELALIRFCMLQASNNSREVFQDDHDKLLNKITKELRKD